MRAARTRAERYSRHGRDDQAGAHLKRALHYGLDGLDGLNGLSGFGGVKRPLDTGDAGHLTTQEALVGAYEQSEPESRLGVPPQPVQRGVPAVLLRQAQSG